MKSLYDYENNINVITTPNGDKVITLNQAIFDQLVNTLYDGADLQLQEGHEATAHFTKILWRTLCDKEKANNEQ